METGSEIPLLRILSVNAVEAERVEATRGKGTFLFLSCIQFDLVLMLMRERPCGDGVSMTVGSLEEING